MYVGVRLGGSSDRTRLRPQSFQNGNIREKRPETLCDFCLKFGKAGVQR